MSSKEEKAAEISASFIDIRQKIAAYRRDFNEFAPSSFEGPPQPIVPRVELCEPCRMVPHRMDIIRQMPKGGRFAEVGTLFGDFIVDVIDIVQPSAVHLFDLGFQNIRLKNRDRLNAFGKVTYHEGDSSTLLAKIPSSFFDIVYIDGDHFYDGVWKDLVQSFRVLKPDGYLICNDWTNWDPLQCVPYGVFSAVNQFANENNLEFTHLGLSGFGFHDVALRRKRRAEPRGTSL